MLTTALVSASLVLCAGAGQAQAQTAGEGRGFALIVGVAGPFDKEGKFGVVPACVNDAVAVARVLAQQEYYRGRIKLITLGVPEKDRTAKIDGVDWTYDLPIGEVDVRDALWALACPEKRPQDAAKPEDMVLCYITTHGTVEGGLLRLLMPGYDPSDRKTYVELDRLVDGMRNVKTQMSYVINACESGGGTLQGAGAEYLSQIFSNHKVWRGVLTACQGSEVSNVAPGGIRTVFGQVFERELVGNEAGDPVAFMQLVLNVKAKVTRENAQQHPYSNLWAAGGGDTGVISRPKRVPLLKGVAWLQALSGANAGKLLPRLERADALRVVSRYAVDVGEKGGDVLTADDVAAILRLNTLAVDAAEMGAWEADRYGASLTEAERLARRKAWVQAIKEYVAQAPTDEPPPTARAYYEKLAASGLPPVIRIVPYDPKQEPQETVPGLAPETAKLTLGPATPASTPQPSGLKVSREARLPLLVSASNPLLKCEPQPSGSGLSAAHVSIAPYVASLVAGGDLQEVRGPQVVADGACDVRLYGPRTQLRLTLTEKNGALASSPRLVEVSCPGNLVLSEPTTTPVVVTEPQVTFRGQVWCESGEAKVMVGEKAAALGPVAEGVYPWSCEFTDLKEGRTPFAVVGTDAQGKVIGEIVVEVDYQPVKIVPATIADLPWMITPNQGLVAGQPVKLEAYIPGTKTVLLRGEGKLDGRNILVAEDRVEPAPLHRVSVEVEPTGALRPEDLVVEPLAG